MTRRWGTAYEWVRRFLEQRQLSKGMDGQTCEICLKQKDEHGVSNLVVEHINNLEDDYRPDNLRYSHQSCNVKKNPPNQFPRDIPHESVREGKPRPPTPSQKDGYSAVKNAEGEPMFREWVFAYLLQHRENPPTPRFLVNNGAALVGENPVTVDRYLDKMTAELFGSLDDTHKNKAGQKIVVLRELEDYSLTVEQLVSKYPWEGMRFRTKPEISSPVKKEVEQG